MRHSGQDQPEIDWEEILPKLHAFTRSFMGDLTWFRGEGTGSFLMGKEIDDYVYDAIGRFLQDQTKYDRARGTLLAYLKLNVIRGLISNDIRKKENRTTDDVFGYSYDGDEEGDDDLTYEEKILPCTEALFEDQVDYNMIKEFIQKEIQGDENAEKIFLGIYEYNYERRDVIEEFDMSPNDFDNGHRRLKTVFVKASIHFKVNKGKA